jgi:DHA1 family multidrug resistance protein-like MFS transporter
MKDLIRESALGQLIRLLSRNKLLRYLEEYDDFQNPLEKVLHQPELPEGGKEDSEESSLAQSTGVLSRDIIDNEMSAGGRENVDEEKAQTQPTADIAPPPHVEHVTSANHVLVTWYDKDDADNPQNWSSWKKHYVAFVIG